MRTITVDVSDEVADQLDAIQDRLPELMALSLRQSAVPAQLYRSILTFLASAPSTEQIAAFTPPTEAQERLQVLLARERSTTLTPVEQEELAELEHIEHLMVMLKASALPVVAASA